MKRAVELSPADSFAHHYLGRVYLETQNYSEALAELNRSRTAFPTDPTFLLQLSAAYISTSRPVDAKQSLNELISQPLTDQQAAQTASLLVRNHENDQAINLLSKLGETKSWAQFDLGIAYLFAREYGKASESAIKYLDHTPPNPAAAWSLIGIANARLGRIVPSLDGFRKPHLSVRRRKLIQPDSRVDGSEPLSRSHRRREEGLAANPRSYALHLD